MKSIELLQLAASLPEGEPKTDLLHSSRVQRLREEVLACTNCALSESTKPVPFSGPTRSPVLIVGEAPGRDEEVHGVPFVGRSGGLLDAALLDAGLQREDVAVANGVCCRPPNNNFDLAVKADAPGRCRPFLERTIDLVDPQIIVPLGAKAMSLFLTADSDPRITQVAGKQTWWLKGRLIAPYFHPAYILRNPALKPDFTHHWHRVQSWVTGMTEFPKRPKNYLPEWELAEIAKGRYVGQDGKVAEHFKKKGWVAIHSDVIDERMVIVNEDKLPKVPERWASLPRYTLDEVVKLRGATVGQFLGVHLAKKEFGAVVVS